MDDDSIQPKKCNGKTTLIFNGTFLSSNEIFIHTPSIFYDALKHSSKHSFTKEIPTYQYLEFHHKRQIRFHYLDGIHQKKWQDRIRSRKFTVNNGSSDSLICSTNHFY